MTKLIAAFRSFAKAPSETINCIYLRKHHPSLETCMASKASRAT